MAVRVGWWLLSFLLLSGCMGAASRPWSSERTAGLSNPSGKLDFGWRLSGDRGVAPLQVFSDMSRIWLQWLPGQVLPVIVGVNAQGEQVVTYTRQEPYTVIDGDWSGLYFRGNGQQARARRLSAGSLVVQTPRSSVDSPSVVASAEGATPVQVDRQEQAQQQTKEQPNAVASHTARPFYSVSHTDVHLRQALTRWARLSGWRFQAEHWAVDIDIPLSASASFSDDFVGSVQALMASTELADRPLQPCFYANQVLRIVPLAEPCDRTVGDGATI